MEIQRVSQNFGKGIDLTADNRACSENVELHWHDFYEIELIISGSGKYSINENAYDIRPGTLFFTTPLDFHHVEPEGEIRYYNITFSENWIENELYPELITSGAITGAGEAAPLFQKLLEDYQGSKKYRMLSLRCSLNQALLYVCRHLSPALAPVYLSPPLQKALSYIQLHFKEELDLKALAKEAGLSAGYLSKVFHDTTGKTFKEYVNALRMQYAVKLLRHSDRSISEICYSSGFQSLPNFLRQFKDRYHTSPGKYKKQLKDAENQ